MKDCPFVTHLVSVIPADIREAGIPWVLSVLGMIALTCALGALRQLP